MHHPSKQAIIVTDLGYGDAGKGTVVDALTRHHNAHTVIRFNGGAQAAHNVVTPDGRHHTFAQFGSGIFVPGVQSYLSQYMLIDPYAMFNEEAHLRALGVPDAFTRTWIDRRARVISPYQQVTNRLRELARGSARHGSCGVGIGETVADHQRYGEAVIFAGDMPDEHTTRRKLTFLRDAKWADLTPLLPLLRPLPEAAPLLAVFDDPELVEIAAENYAYLAGLVRIVDEFALQRFLNAPGTLVFEGAQGVLLDETYGFAPYTTWSCTTFANALALLEDYEGEITRLGVLRTYFTRHGAGPFVTEEPALLPHLPEAHNTTSAWQQHFRVGYFDLVAARYALAVAGGADALAITHVDYLAHLGYIGTAYRAQAHTPGEYFMYDNGLVTAIRHRPAPPWEHQLSLTQHLLQCEPVYTPIQAASYLAFLAEALHLPIALISYGKTAAEKTFFP
ncbi:MAG: adenylosuccinate synthase [Anaerolineae bacterium]